MARQSPPSCIREDIPKSQPMQPRNMQAASWTQGIAALVLVAPAIVALRLGRREAAAEAAEEQGALLRGDQVRTCET